MRFHRGPHLYVERVHLKVTDLERSLKFYQEVIGFQVKERSETAAALTADGETVLLTIEQPRDVIPKTGRTTGLYHFALLLPTREHLAQIVRHFAELGLRIGSADHLVSEALYLSDPDGNGIEIYRDRHPSEWEWEGDQVKMSTDPLRFQELLAMLDRTNWKRLPAETVVGHIHLHVAWLSEAEQFYVNGLGFEVVCRYGTQALFVSDGKYHHHIGLNTWNGEGAPEPPNNSAGLRSFTLVYPSEAAREEAISRLRRIGATVTEDNGTWTVADPSGNRMILYAAKQS